MPVDFEFIVPDEAVPFILYQRTAYLTQVRSLWYRLGKKIAPRFFYRQLILRESRQRKEEIKSLFYQDMMSEYKQIREFLPDDCQSILDIGCGVGGIDVLLFRHYENKSQLKLHLLDKTQTSDRVYYGFQNKGAYYNSLELTREFLAKNGFPVESVNLYEATADARIPLDGKVDLVISLLSWGHHYPVSTYLEQVYEHLRPGGYLILDIRNNTEGEKELTRKFSSLRTISTGSKCSRVLAIR